MAKKTNRCSMQIETKNCSKYNHPEFVLEVQRDYLQGTLQHLADGIEEMVATGSRFKPKQTFQFGLSLTTVQSYDKTRLTLHEPDMRSMPIAWVPGVTWTVEQMFLQISCLQSVGWRPELKNVVLNASLLACPRFRERSFFMNRMEPSDDCDSGWFVGCNDDDHDHNNLENLRRISLYEALLGQPDIGPFLTFPFEASITFDRGRELKIQLEEENIEIAPGTFLHEWFRRK